MNKEADILASTYEDTCCVYRPQLLDDEESLESSFLSGEKGKCIYQDIPCAYSSQSGGQIKKGVIYLAENTQSNLFVRPEICIEKSDFIVIKRLGHEIKALAGLSEYHLSHNKIPLKIEELEA